MRRGALSAHGEPQGPFGSVPSQVSLEQAQESACSAMLSLLASLKRVVGDLDNVAAWMTVNGFINADPGYAQTTLVMNPASELLLDIFGPGPGSHARIALASPPFPSTCRSSSRPRSRSPHSGSAPAGF